MFLYTEKCQRLSCRYDLGAKRDKRKKHPKPPKPIIRSEKHCQKTEQEGPKEKVESYIHALSIWNIPQCIGHPGHPDKENDNKPHLHLSSATSSLD